MVVYFLFGTNWFFLNIRTWRMCILIRSLFCTFPNRPSVVLVRRPGWTTHHLHNFRQKIRT